MSRPRLGQKNTRRLLLEALEDRRVMTGLSMSAAAFVEIAVSAPAHVAALEQSAKVSVVVQADADDAPSHAAAKLVHQQIVELRHEYQDARKELRQDFKEERAELREEQHDLRVEATFETPLAQVAFNAAVNDARVELNQQLHEQLDELREELRTEVITLRDELAGNDHQNDDNNNGRPDDAGNNPIQNLVRGVSENLQSPERVIDNTNDATESLQERNPITSESPSSQNDRIVPPDANQAVLPSDAVTDQQQTPTTRLQDALLVRTAATPQDLGSPTSAATSTEESSGAGTTGAAEEAEVLPEELVIEEPESDAALQGAGLAAGDAAFNIAAIDAALQQIAQSADQLARTLTQNPSYLAWLLASLAGGVGIEMVRRRKKARRAALAAASLTANSTLSWVPGMPGSFSDEDK